MNWFQIVFLREDSQEKDHESASTFSCELISNCIFTWGFTSKWEHTYLQSWLWIDFKLYFYVRIHKRGKRNGRTWSVVNWFQIVFLREDSQDNAIKHFATHGCELISNCIFTWGFTSNQQTTKMFLRLWIDFILYFYVRIHKGWFWKNRRRRVVNWFQIVFLREDSQVERLHTLNVNCCELISNCIFTWGFTRIKMKLNYKQ